MAHRYIVFPIAGPVDGIGRPIGMCECGRWKDSTDPLEPCANATQNLAQPGNEFHPLIFTS